MNTANSKKLIYICSPLKGDIAANIAKAREYCKTVLSMGYIPIAPHVMLDGILNDENPAERKTALEMGLELVVHCDELWIFSEVVSVGMQAEIDLARERDIPVKEVCFDFECKTTLTKQWKSIKGILHTSGKTEEEICSNCDVGEITPEDIKNQIAFYNLMDGMEAMFLPFPNGDYALICPAHEKDCHRLKEAHYLMEQDSLFGCYIEDRARFEKDWDTGEYSSDGSFCFSPKEVEIVETEPNTDKDKNRNIEEILNDIKTHIRHVGPENIAYCLQDCTLCNEECRTWCGMSELEGELFQALSKECKEAEQS